MDNIYNFEKELEKYGLTTVTYESLCKDIDAKIEGNNDLDWSEIKDKYNLPVASDTIRKASSCVPFGAKFRIDYLKNQIYTNPDDFSKEKEIDKKIEELRKEQVKTRDERNELSRVIREQARRESYKDQILRSISEYQSSPLSYDESKQFTGILKTDNDLIISMTDLHTGIEIDNYFNKFNEDVLRDRLNQYLDKVFEVQLRHGSENAFVILSELVSGIIHNELRIENNQNLIEQFSTVTDYISQFLSELSYHFNTVHVYVCPGNHSRISPKKEDSLKGENIDHLAIPFLEAKLQNFSNISFHKNEIEESIAMFSVRNKTIMSSHGDKDSPSNVVQKFTLLFGIKPSIVYLGHRHSNGLTTVYDTKVVESGCLSGVDNFALNMRIKGKPSQTISVVTEKGLDCLYNVEFD